MLTYRPVIFDDRLLAALVFAPIIAAVVFTLPIGQYSNAAAVIIPMVSYPLMLLFGVPYHVAMRKTWEDGLMNYWFAGFIFGFIGIFFLTDSQAGVSIFTLLMGGVYGGLVAVIARLIAGPIHYETTVD